MFLSIPMALAGALLFFWLGVVSVKIYTQIGLLALVSSIIRHGILLVEFANDIQVEEGKDWRAAMKKAAALRLRAILMTAVATVIGLVPLLIASGGPGAASRFAISFTLGVGMLIGTFFTLYMVPALYTVVTKGVLPKKIKVQTKSMGRNGSTAAGRRLCQHSSCGKLVLQRLGERTTPQPVGRVERSRTGLRQYCWNVS